ncbi:hypothetical protein [Pectobacterium polonicum]|uniref:hypothetical protein n=1 Tax=Pectobacterium polonicum TaxID=2485124 RepID=UPI002B24E3FD|nr:hypothetical protein [Pectobacterium polonicum]
MTAEIIVKNSVGCALAADSAVTTTTAMNGTVKIYNNAEKIFELSKNHPVGLMIFNNSDFCGTPWELSIRTYRKNTRNTDEKDQLSYYTDDFLNFLSESFYITPEEKRKEKLINIFRWYIRTHYNNLSQGTLLQGLPPDDNDALSLIHQRLLEFYRNENSTLDQNAYFHNFNENDFHAAIIFAREYHFNVIKDIIPYNQNNYEYPESLKNEIIKFFANIICKENISPLYSGLIFSGFGKNEFYPVVITIKIYGWFNGKVIYSYSHGKCSQCNPDNATIIPFASEDEVFTFVQGCNNSILNFIETTCQQLSNVVIDRAISRGINDRELIDEINNLKTNLMYRVNSHIQNNFSQRVTAMLNSLSKKDLAYMAESLVNLSAFKLKISDAYETVGGPIDVAVISKTDGFIWIKRKLYFDKELNNTYLRTSI